MSFFTPHSPSPYIQRREWQTAVTIALITLFLLAIPYALGYLLARPGTFFTGLIMNPEDAQTYLAKMVEGFNGRYLYTIPFTPEPHAAAFVGVFYVWLGQLARLTGLGVLGMWHLSLAVADLTLFLSTYFFIAVFLPEPSQRQTAYWLALLGSGLGWLAFVVGVPMWAGTLPLDFREPGAHLFFTAFTFPHVAVGTALTLWSVYFVWRMVVEPSWQTAVAAGLCNLGLSIAYPFLIYLIAGIMGLFGLYQLVQQKKVPWLLAAQWGLALLIPLPLNIYYAVVLQSNPVFAAWSAQSITPTFHWTHYVVAYGPMVGMALWWAWRKPAQQPPFAILWAWLLAVLILLNLPTNPQRRFVQGVHIPLAIFTAVAYSQMTLPWLQQSRPFQALLRLPRYEWGKLSRFMTMLFVLCMSMSNFYVWASVAFSNSAVQPDPLFRPIDEQTAVAWLNTHTDSQSVVLGDYQTGSYIGGTLAHPVMIGHWSETKAYETKAAAVAQFYASDTSDSWRQAFLHQWGIGVVWFGPREQALGGFQPSQADYLEPIYHNDSITLFAVRPQP